MCFELGDQTLGSHGNKSGNYVLEAQMQSQMINSNSVLKKDILVSFHSQDMQPSAFGQLNLFL